MHRRLAFGIAAALVLALGVAGTDGARAQAALEQGPLTEPPPKPPLLIPPTQPSPPPPRGPEDPLGRGTPRGAVGGFLGAARDADWVRAADYLDLRRVPAARRAEEGPELAKQLASVLQRTTYLQLSDLSDEPEGNAEDGLPSKTDRLATLSTKSGDVDLKLVRSARDDGQLVWRVAADTVRQVPALHEEFGIPAYAAQLPDWLVETRFFGIALWQWFGFGALLALAALAGWIFEIVLRRVVLLFAGTSRAGAARILGETGGPLRLVLGLLVYRAGQPWLRLPLVLEQVLGVFVDALWVVAGTWIVLRVVEAISQRIVRRLTDRGQLSATALVPAGRRIARFVVLALGLLFALRTFGVNVTAIIAGLGVGGLAVALAAQKTLENLFGGITIIADAPVRVGEFCRFGASMGTVEEIGLRSTRVRTPDRTIISVPNADFAAMQVENLTRRDRFRLFSRISLRSDTTPAQLTGILEAIPGVMSASALVDAASARAHVVSLGPTTIDLEIEAAVRTREAEKFAEVRDEVFLGVMRAIDAAGTGLAAAPPAPSGPPAR